MTNPCVALHADTLGAINSAATYPCDIAAMGMGDSAREACQSIMGAATEDALWEADKKVLCSIFCCCQTNGRQACVEQTLDAAERRALDDSRYKAEVSYNMQTRPPTPMMQKENFGRDLSTTKIGRGDIGHLAGTAGKYFEEELQRPAGPGGARWRRPDVVIVRDPTKPPTQGNISRVVEMKFPGDTADDDVMRDYASIAGSPDKLELMEADDCGCSQDERPKEPVGEPYTIWDRLRDLDRELGKHLPKPGEGPFPIPIPLPGPKIPKF